MFTERTLETHDYGIEIRSYTFNYNNVYNTKLQQKPDFVKRIWSVQATMPKDAESLHLFGDICSVHRVQTRYPIHAQHSWQSRMRARRYA